jgi:hypothetical protein
MITCLLVGMDKSFLQVGNYEKIKEITQRLDENLSALYRHLTEIILNTPI